MHKPAACLAKRRTMHTPFVALQFFVKLLFQVAPEALLLQPDALIQELHQAVLSGINLPVTKAVRWGF